MVDRSGQVWETPGKEIWLVTSSRSEGFGKVRHSTAILSSRVSAVAGRASWHFEQLGERRSWETPRWEDAKGWTRLA